MIHKICFLLFLPFFLLLFSCNRYTEEFGKSFGTGEYSTSETMTAGNDADSTSANTTKSSDDNEIEKLDVFAVDMKEFEACEQIDFLFVIDNSGSMSDNQENLIMNFPNFVNGIVNNIPDLLDYHVGVITTDDYAYNETGCKMAGALVTEHGGYNQIQTVCGPFADGFRYINENDNLDEKFSCVANVGTNGNGTERPLEALSESFDPFLNAPGNCNDQFFREGAPLVVVIITDEDDASGGTAADYYNYLSWIKDPDDFVVLSLIGLSISDCTSYDSVKLSEFTSYFKYGLTGDVCFPDYGYFFDQATSWVVASCYGYPPPIQ